MATASVVLTLTNAAGQFASAVTFKVYNPDQTSAFTDYTVAAGGIDAGHVHWSRRRQSHRSRFSSERRITARPSPSIATHRFPAVTRDSDLRER